MSAPVRRALHDRAIGGAVAFLLTLGAGAVAAQDGAAWLQRIYTASQKLSYTGTFVYQGGGETQTSRIIRVVESSGVRERLETLDGVPREVLRNGEDVVCYLPQAQTKKVDKQPAGRSLAPMQPDRPREVAENYVIRKGEVERVAGHEAQVLLLEPRDTARYGHKLWADVATGMLLKAKTYNERNEPMEQLTFTQVQIGGAIDREQLRSRFERRVRDWRIEDAGAAQANLAQVGWSVRPPLPGFRKVTEMTRTLGGTPGVGHIVLSDGLAAVSVFIEPASDRPSQPQGEVAQLMRQGAINMYVRQIGPHRIIVVGETPAESVRSIAQAVEYRKPN